jgi:aldehyde dehydrogenase
LPRFEREHETDSLNQKESGDITMRYAHPGTEGAIVNFKERYGNYIGGEFVAPVKGEYFTTTSPVNGKPIAEFPRSSA